METLLLLLCIVLLGIATFIRQLGLQLTTVYQFLLLTSICYTFCIPIWIWLAGKQIIQTPLNLGSILYAVIYSGFSLLAGFIFTYLLKNSATPSVLVVMINLNSIITFFLCCIFLREQITVIKLIAVFLSILGFLLISL